MTEQYTPTTDEVRLEYMAVRWGKNDIVSFEARAEFDRWLAEVRRQAAAAGFAQGVDRTLAVTGVKTCPGDGLLTLIGNPYAAEAYRQERKEQ